MRALAIIVALAAATALSAPAAVAASTSPASPAHEAAVAKAEALAKGDWRRAAEFGASAADVVRALQAKGRFTDMVPEEAVVSIGPDNSVDAVDLKPLPPLPADVAAGAGRTAGLSGPGFSFAARPGSITLYPADAPSFSEPRKARP
jgi:hypothetical protein